MTRLPTVKQLSYFVALDRREHFGRAAEACFVSQSAFSGAIRELESTLDVRLVDRTTKQVAITPLGREVAAQARLVLRDIEQLVQMAGAGREPLTGRMTLGVIPTIAPFLLPKVLPSIRQKYPRLQAVHPRRYDGRRSSSPICSTVTLDVILDRAAFRAAQHRASRKCCKDRFLLAARRGYATGRPADSFPSTA